MQSRSRNYRLDVKDSVIDPYVKRRFSQSQGSSQSQGQGDKKQAAFYKKSADDKILYKVWLYLEGPDLPFVNRVTYKLHRTFPNPVKMVDKTIDNPNCALVIWTWGLFTVEVDIEDKNSRVISTKHELRYNNEFDEVEWQVAY